MAVEYAPELNLTRGGLMLIALLRGGDYDQVRGQNCFDLVSCSYSSCLQHGLAGCGIVIAHKLTKYGLGDSLLLAAETSEPVQLNSFLKTWREDLRTVLSTDPAGHLGQRCVAVANAVTANFPDPRIIELYAHPKTTSSEGGPGPPALHPTEFDIPKLVSICEHHFGWNDASKIMSHLWEAVCLHTLHQVCDLRSVGSHFHSMIIAPPAGIFDFRFPLRY